VNENASRIVSVEIHGQRYPIRSSLDAAYVTELASYVDGKMQAANDEAPTGDSLKVAVLAALNIADEFFRCREAERIRQGRLTRRAEELERLLDRALGNTPWADAGA
jgi:cell division protein ZapA